MMNRVTKLEWITSLLIQINPCFTQEYTVIVTSFSTKPKTFHTSHCKKTMPLRRRRRGHASHYATTANSNQLTNAKEKNPWLVEDSNISEGRSNKCNTSTCNSRGSDGTKKPRSFPATTVTKQQKENCSVPSPPPRLDMTTNGAATTVASIGTALQSRTPSRFELFERKRAINLSETKVDGLKNRLSHLRWLERDLKFDLRLLKRELFQVKRPFTFEDTLLRALASNDTIGDEERAEKVAKLEDRKAAEVKRAEDEAKETEAEIAAKERELKEVKERIPAYEFGIELKEARIAWKNNTTVDEAKLAQLEVKIDHCTHLTGDEKERARNIMHELQMCLHPRDKES